MKRNSLVALVAALVVAIVSLAMAGDVRNPATYGGRIEDRSRICMIQDQVQAKSGLAYAYQGKTYYLCCAGCVAGFAANPEHLRRAKDPVSGEPVDKAEAPAYAWHGRAYFFRSEANLEAFARDPDSYLSAGRQERGPNRRRNRENSLRRR
ncbi:MAG: YHS domain-containing protein [Deltaproteobacteria bacterium]|nr:YHS domain-containing protein [Deltaproteobacteria bacterium]